MQIKLRDCIGKEPTVKYVILLQLNLTVHWWNSVTVDVCPLIIEQKQYAMLTILFQTV